MADLPSGTLYGTVVGQFVQAVGDTAADTNRDPDREPIRGTITFTPRTDRIVQDASSLPNPVTVFAREIKGKLDENGYLIGADYQKGVRLVASNSPGKPTNFTYTVTFEFEDVKLPPVEIFVPAGQTIDLTTVLPVPANTGYEIARWRELLEQVEAAAASVPSMDELWNTMGSSFSRRTVVRPAGYGPQFQDAGVTLYSHNQTGLSSLYAPQLYPIGALDPDWDGPYWISPNSTDHNEASAGVPGPGGVCIMVRDDEDPIGPFVSHRVGGNPVIYVDTTLGAQTEWPRFVYMPDDPDGKPHYLYYQQEAVGRGQSTLLAKTDNPLDPTRYVRVGVVMQGAPTLSNGSAGPGDGQTTYADPFPWGESIGFVTIDGGGSLAGAKVLWRSDDGIRCTRNPRRIADRTDLTGDTTLRFVYGTPFQWRGEWFATLNRSGWGSGLWLDTDARPYVAKVSADLRSIVSKPYPMLPGNVLPAGVTSAGLGVPVGFGDKILVPYRANGRFGHIRAYIAEA